MSQNLRNLLNMAYAAGRNADRHSTDADRRKVVDDLVRRGEGIEVGVDHERIGRGFQMAMKELPFGKRVGMVWLARWIDARTAVKMPFDDEPQTVRVAWEPQFDACSGNQEKLAIQFSNEICGGHHPCPVRILEMAEALYRAERDHVVSENTEVPS